MNACPIPARYARSGYRGYRIPGRAIVGASDTGTWPDSPCPTPRVKAEIRRFQRECLAPLGIRSHTRLGATSNLFCGKRWLCVAAKDWLRAATLAQDWLAANKFSTDFVHDAGQAAVIAEAPDADTIAIPN